MNTSTKNRRRLSTSERQAMQSAALERAQNGQTCANDLVIVAEFAARGIDAHPRQDVYTFNAWRALGRHVKKGEHGVHIAAYAHTEREKPDGTTEQHTYPTSATVFHVSQTEPDEPKQPRMTAQERGTLANIEATQRQDKEADERDDAEDAHELALQEAEQRDDARPYTIIDPLTGNTLYRGMTTPETRPIVSTRTSEKTGQAQPSLF